MGQVWKIVLNECFRYKDAYHKLHHSRILMHCSFRLHLHGHACHSSILFALAPQRVLNTSIDLHAGYTMLRCSSLLNAERVSCSALTSSFQCVWCEKVSCRHCRNVFMSLFFHCSLSLSRYISLSLSLWYRHAWHLMTIWRSLVTLTCCKEFDTHKKCFWHHLEAPSQTSRNVNSLYLLMCCPYLSNILAGRICLC